jgi:hypothetical protein
VRIWSIHPAALGIYVATVVAGCGGSHQPISAPGVIPQSNAIAPSSSSSYQVLYNFDGKPDGADPAASLIKTSRRSPSSNSDSAEGHHRKR